MNNIIMVTLDASRYAEAPRVRQYDYGQTLRIQGGDLPKVVEVHYSMQEKSGDSTTRIGTTIDGVIEAPVPDSMLENNDCAEDYTFYAYIYVEDGVSGNTEYEIAIPVTARSKPEVPGTPEEPELFRETIKAVNAAADRAEQAEQNAKASAIEAGKYVASASESAVAALKTKEDALKEVGEKKQEAIEAIQEQEETSVGKITTHTDDEIQRILNQTAESKGELEQSITNAGASKEELDHSIETAGTSKTALDKSTELAGTAKTELDMSIREAGEAKTALDGSTNTAGEMQETLSETVKQAGALDTSLGEKIETGTQLKTDLVASGEKAVQDIQTAGSEQMGKMQAVAEEFTADREQITTNKEDIGSIKEDIGKIQEETADISNKINRIIENNICPNMASTIVSNGVTYTPVDGGILVNGKAVSTSYGNIFMSKNSLPKGFTAGRTYKFVFNGYISRLVLHVRWCNKDGDWSYLYNGYKDTYITIPPKAIGLQIRVCVNTGFEFANSKIHIFAYDASSINVRSAMIHHDCKPMISIIYDDGEQEFYDYILPIIRKKNVPIATAIITEYIGTSGVMDYSEIKECYENGAEILCHAVAHDEKEWNEMGINGVSSIYRKTYHKLNANVCNVPSVLVYSGRSHAYPVCCDSAQKEFKCAIAAAASSVSGAIINKKNDIFRYNIERSYSDGASVENMKAWIDELELEGTGWVIFMRHNTRARASMGISDTAEQDASKLSEVIDYATEKCVSIVSVERGLYEYLGI